VRGQPGFELSEGFGHVPAAVAETDVARFVIDGSRKKEDAGLANHLFAEGQNILLRLETDEADGAGVGRRPLKELGVAREEGRELGEIAENNLEIAIDEFLAVAESKGGEELTGSASADGGVVLEGDDFVEEGGVVGGEPCEAQAGEAVGFADGAETQGAVVKIAGGGESRGRIVLEFAVNLVGENIDVMASGEIKNVTENTGRHEQARGVVRGIDVDGTGVGTNEGFENGEVVGPGVGGIAGPLTDSRSGASWEGESAFVAGCFDDSVIVGSKKRMVEEEDGFFGSGDNDELAGMNLIVDGGEDFAEPGRAGRFGVAAPVLEEGIVGAGFEREKFFDGLRFGVGGGEQVLGGEFVLAHVFFNTEGSDFHKRESGKDGG